MKKVTVALLLVIVLGISITSCSARNKVRFEGTLNLGELPADMLYVDGKPQIITISTESDGDVILAYYSSDMTHVYGQLYGCSYISLNCPELHMQGRYSWTIPNNK